MGERADRVPPTESFSDIRASGGFARLSPNPPRPVRRTDAVAGTTDDSPGGTETIEVEIDQTRAELSETIEAIQNRLDPGLLADQARGAATDATEQAKEAALAVVDHTIQEVKAAVRDLADQAKAEVRDATIGKVVRMTTTTSETARGFGSGIVATVKQNPGPAALTALGIGWLIASGKSGGAQPQPAVAPRTAPPQSTETTATERSPGEAGQGVGETIGGIADQVQATTGAAIDQIQATTGQVADRTQDVAVGLTTQVGEAAGGVASGLGHAVGGIATGVGDAAGWVKQQAQQSAGRVRNAVTEKPLPAGAVALTLGGALAFTVPKSPRENQLLGEARDKVISQAETAAENLIHKVQNVAEEAGEAVAKEAKYQGLAAES
jgi:hypothetical protein